MGLFLLFLAFLGSFTQPKNCLLQVPLNSTSLNILKQNDFKPIALMDNAVIVEVKPAGVMALDEARIAYKTLLDSVAFSQAKENQSFYFIFPPFRKKSASAFQFLNKHGRILGEADNYYLYLTTPKFAHSLPSLRYEITHIPLVPIMLPEAIDDESPLPSPLELDFNPVINQIIAQITPTECAQLLRELSGEVPVTVRNRLDTIRTRYATTLKNSTALWFWYEKLQTLTGLDSIKFHLFTWQGSNTDSNIIATKLGTSLSQGYYIIGGHIDNTSETPTTYAPGADDNGTGSVAMLMAAKYLHSIPFKYTIRFIAWNAEEFGLYGSQAHAQEARNRNDSILGVLNADMIGTDTINRDSLNIYTGSRSGSRALGDIFYSVNTTYGIDLHIRRSTQMPQYSDHYPYYAQGYNSNCIIEAVFCPYYHTTQDRITANSFDTIFFTKVVKGMIATLATLAQPDTLYKDVGVLEITQPIGTIDSNAVVIPQARVKNYSFTTQTFAISFRIGDFYNEMRSKTLNPGEIDTVNFPPWNAIQVGTHPTKCTTLLTGDMKFSNDYIINSITVVSTGVAENRTNPIPSTFVLANTNPFSGQTLIRYGLPNESKIKLQVYNVLGTLVRNLKIGDEKPGFYTVNWDGLDDNGNQVPKGVYFIRLEAETNRVIRKTIKLY